MSTLTAPQPVWTTSTGDHRYALLDLGTVFHRGGCAPVPVRLSNSPGFPTAPTMHDVILGARGLDGYAAALLSGGALEVWQGAWHDLAESVTLPDLAGDEGVALWFRLVLPEDMELAPLSGRLYLELELTWQ